ncbi:MAG: Methyltransferase type 11 [Bacteroidetes bacterium]|uniref:class I SAM-dependent methyltransferase n=1 Tax=unclassified Chitinophaga TaxID=2619133 RepID=UPI0009C6CD59|nr:MULTISPECIES: class I SAM-dependent methyltransferase [unclassified Chitinophaga]MBP1651283.1 Methyltransferase type 11 [Bacteroidota bacterium]OMP76881.1 SAM-dependent methyltransferase [[Flexibacter] sp. ATCC 35208]WPV67318.1 class I SAM-dependent methyltransferase [Chitinophaga sp. LS1]
MFDPSKLQMLENRLVKVYRHIGKIARRQNITCYRVYDDDINEFPFSVDRYDDHIYVAEYDRPHGMDEETHETWLDSSLEVVGKVLDVPLNKIWVKQRQRKASRQEQYEKLSFESHEVVVHEAGLKFKVNLSDYLDTGLFLDHRITRGMVRESAKDMKVLNLFCYTGSFSVYAAAGGASEVVSVDLSKTYLAWAEENMQLNDLKGNFQFVHADVLQYLDTLPADYFDLVVLDPPTFSNSKRMKEFLDIQRDHVVILNKVLHATKPGGVVYFSNNYRKFQLDTEQIQAGTIKDITGQTMPFDFQQKLIRKCYKIIK